MEKNNEPDAFLQKLTGELERLDMQYDDILTPSLQELEQLIAAEAIQRRRRARKELLLFWCVSLILLGSSLIILGYAPAVYWLVQAVIPILGLSGLVVARIRREREGTEE